MAGASGGEASGRAEATAEHGARHADLGGTPADRAAAVRGRGATDLPGGDPRGEGPAGDLAEGTTPSVPARHEAHESAATGGVEGPRRGPGREGAPPSTGHAVHLPEDPRSAVPQQRCGERDPTRSTDPQGQRGPSDLGWGEGARAAVDDLPHLSQTGRLVSGPNAQCVDGLGAAVPVSPSTILSSYEMVTGPLGFEPRFEAPEASVISKLYYGPAARANVPPSKGCPLNVG